MLVEPRVPAVVIAARHRIRVPDGEGGGPCVEELVGLGHALAVGAGTTATAAVVGRTAKHVIPAEPRIGSATHRVQLTFTMQGLRGK